jgi:tellurite resistance protein TerC
MTISLLVLLIVCDLAIVSRRTGVMKRTTAIGWVIFYISLAAIFAVVLLITGGSSLGGQFAAGYVTEYRLIQAG